MVSRSHMIYPNFIYIKCFKAMGTFVNTLINSAQVHALDRYDPE